MAEQEPSAISKSPSSLGEAFAAVVRRAPEAVAITGVGAGGDVTFSELEQRSRAVASSLAAQGVGAGDRVLVALGRGTDFITAILGIARIGGAYVPVDPLWPASRLLELAEIVKPSAVVGEPIEGLRLKSLRVSELITGSRAEGCLDVDVKVAPDHPLYVMFTSGTTGTPKAVVVPHRAVCRLVLQPDFMDFGPDRTWLQLAATSFDAATLEIWMAIVHGGRIVPVTDELPTIDRIADLIAEHGVTDAWLTASLFNAVVDYRIDAFRNMKQVLTGGERLSPVHVERFLDRWPHIRLINGYGPTENTTFTCCHTITREDVANPDGIPIGNSIVGTDVRIVNDRLEDVAQGDRGELLAGGAGLALGYLGDDQLTSERFVDVGSGKGVWYRTGDLVSQPKPDGPISFLGRVDRQVKVRGYRIELEDVERGIQDHPGVGEAFAFTVGDRADNRRLVVGCTRSADEGDEPNAIPQQIRAWISSRTQPYLVPDVIVMLDAVPVTSTGKADMKSIFATIQRAIGLDDSHALQDTAPGSDQGSRHWDEFRVMVAEVLPGTAFTASDGFVAIGGHSIAALRLAALVQQRCGVELGVGEIIGCRALGELAERLRDSRDQPVQGERDRSTVSADGDPAVIPASSIQRQFFFENAVDPTGGGYNEYAAFRITRGKLDVLSLERAFRALVRRHEALRTSLVMVDEGLVQKIAPTDAAEQAFFTVHEQLDWAYCESSGSVPEEITGVISKPFDLEQHLPVRLDVFPTDGTGDLVILSFQHAAVDEWSFGIMQEELAALYANPTAFSDRSEQYRSFSAIEISSVNTGAADEMAERLLSVDQPVIPLGQAPAAAARVALDRGCLDEATLQLISKQNVATPTAVTMAIYASALSEVLGLDRLALLTPVSHRTQPVLQSVVGCCNIMYPLVVDVASQGQRLPLKRVIESVSNGLLAAYDTERVPFELIAQEVHRRGTSRGAVVAFGFAFETNSPFAPRLKGLDVRPCPIRNETARFPIGFSVDNRDGRLHATLSAPMGSGAEALLANLGRSIQRITDQAIGRAGRASTSVEDSRRVVVRAAAPSAVAGEDQEQKLRIAARHAWKELLGSPPADNASRFFDHGGHSLLLLRLAARIRTETGIEIPLAAFLKEPTFGNLVRELVNASTEQESDQVGFQIEELGTGSKVVIGIPGAFGRPISFQQLADSLDAAESDIRLRCYNVFDAMNHGDMTEGFDQVLARLAQDIEHPDTVGILGFCAGGLYPLFLESLPQEKLDRLHLWLLNVFAPEDGDHAIAMRLRSLSEAVRDFRSFPRACVNSMITLALMASSRLQGKEEGLSTDDFSRAEFQQLLIRRELRPWHGKTTVFIAGRKPVWRTHYRNDRLNGLVNLICGPSRTVLLPLLHHELLGRGAQQISHEIRRDVTSSPDKVSE